MDRSWASPRPRWVSFSPTLAVPSALSRRQSVLEGFPGFKNYFFEAVTGQQKNALTLISFATTSYEKSKDEKSVERSWNPATARYHVMLQNICLAAAVGRSPHTIQKLLHIKQCTADWTSYCALITLLHATQATTDVVVLLHAIHL